MVNLELTYDGANALVSILNTLYEALGNDVDESGIWFDSKNIRLIDGENVNEFLGYLFDSIVNNDIQIYSTIWY